MKRFLAFAIVCAIMVLAHSSESNNAPPHVLYTHHFLRNFMNEKDAKEWAECNLPPGTWIKSRVK